LLRCLSTMIVGYIERQHVLDGTSTAQIHAIRFIWNLNSESLHVLPEVEADVGCVSRPRTSGDRLEGVLRLAGRPLVRQETTAACPSRNVGALGGDFGEGHDLLDLWKIFDGVVSDSSTDHSDFNLLLIVSPGIPVSCDHSETVSTFPSNSNFLAA